MSKSILTIHKEMEKKAFSETEMGKLEKKLRTFYDNLVTKSTPLPEEYAKQIYDIRVNHEQKQMDYIKESQVRDAKAIDEMLMDAFTKEVAIIEDYQSNSTTTMNDK